LTNIDKLVINKYIDQKQQLEIKRTPKVFVEVLECNGILPEARESATMCTHKNSIYVFGGTGSKKFDYFNKYDMDDQKWFKLEPQNTSISDLPIARFGHTLCTFKSLFILFGG